MQKMLNTRWSYCKGLHARKMLKVENEEQQIMSEKNARTRFVSTVATLHNPKAL